MNKGYGDVNTDSEDVNKATRYTRQGTALPVGVGMPLEQMLETFFGFATEELYDSALE